MTTITKTEKTYSISWDGLVTWNFERREWRGDVAIEGEETDDLKEALETFEEIAASDKNCGTLSLHEWSNVYFWDSEDQEWVSDEGRNRIIKKLKLLGESQD